MARLRLFLFPLFLLMAACSTLGLGGREGNQEKADPSKRAEIWTKGDWFVALEPQDTGKTTANAHPVNISAERLRAALSAIKMRGRRGGSYDLFNRESLDILGIYLSEGLAKAGPRQDIVFAVGTFQRRILGLRTDLAATGRVFNNRNGLNVIIGQLRAPNKRYESEAELKALNKDTRLNPYIPGLRNIRQSQEVGLRLPSNQVGVFTKSRLRPDWFVFTEEGLVPTAAESGAVAVGGDNNELSRLRREVEMLKGRMGQETPRPGGATLETKLTALKDLRDKGLISAEDYAEKRRELLEQF